MSIDYEWTVEWVDVEGDIQDNDFADTYAQVLKRVSQGTDDQLYPRIGLVRDRSDNVRGLVCRSWAYLDGIKLPEFFEDAYGNEIAKVPQRFHKEVAA